jgi:hypothetical protein
VIVRSAADWGALWAAHSPQPAPAVDFSRALVAGVFLGSRPSAGFRVEIQMCQFRATARSSSSSSIARAPTTLSRRC